MNVYRLLLLLSLAVWAISSYGASPVTSVNFVFPPEHEWKKVTDQMNAGQYLREWIPVEETIETATWLIVEQKILLEKRTSAKNFLSIMMNLAGSACTDVLYNGPEKIVVNGHETYWAKTMCAQQLGKNYGTFTDQRVIVDEKWVFVVTSELRVSPSAKAGQLAFKKGEEFNFAEFMARVKASTQVARSSVFVDANE